MTSLGNERTNIIFIENGSREIKMQGWMRIVPKLSIDRRNKLFLSLNFAAANSW